MCFGLHASWRQQAAEWRKGGREEREGRVGGAGVQRSGGAHAGWGGVWVGAVTGLTNRLPSPTEAVSCLVLSHSHYHWTRPGDN